MRSSLQRKSGSVGTLKQDNSRGYATNERRSCSEKRLGSVNMDEEREPAAGSERPDEIIAAGHVAMNGSINMQRFMLALHNQHQQLLPQQDTAAIAGAAPQSFHAHAPVMLPYCLANHSVPNSIIIAPEHNLPDNHLILAAHQATPGVSQLASGNQAVAAAAGGTGASSSSQFSQLSRYEAQKRRDWNTFGQYLKNHRPPLPLSKCSSAHVLEFLRYLDQFGKTKVHTCGCPFFGRPNPTPPACPCPLRQAWGSLDALIGRLRAAYDEHTGGKPDSNPFGTRAIRLYLREVRELQAKARGIAYAKKKRKRPPPSNTPTGQASHPLQSTSMQSAAANSTPNSQALHNYVNL